MISGLENLTLWSRVDNKHYIMEKQNNLPFPYEFQPFKPEEQEVIDRNYKGVYGLYRVGPKGYVVCEPFIKDAANIYNMPLRSTDTFVATFQRSGTTWTQELVWLLANDLDYATAAAVPLPDRYPFLDVFMYMDLSRVDPKSVDSNLDEETLKAHLTMMSEPASKMLATMPESTPRFIKTHLPLSLLNPKTLDTTKMVYVARDPRDVAVSCYHHARLVKVLSFYGSFKEFWNIFHKNMYMMCPIIEHVKEAWEKRHHPNMLFLFYEELSNDLPGTIRRVADFLGKELTQEQLDRLSNHLTFENFKKNASVNYEEMREHGMLDKDETFVRKGKPGGWRDYFDEEMTQQMERWIVDNLRDTDLRFPSMTISK